eukprot:TRINITY_DN15893_c0_g1_i1.p1 TRINITY_DN15893_c0_g1~~TRINITY_DN15893_c0_g1_i1.p1  ORF type:complete len:450 (-),score=112.38 TRINITY_DN15893_c0_g1_i1:23-1372(-)
MFFNKPNDSNDPSDKRKKKKPRSISKHETKSKNQKTVLSSILDRSMFDHSNDEEMADLVNRLRYVDKTDELMTEAEQELMEDLNRLESNDPNNHEDSSTEDFQDDVSVDQLIQLAGQHTVDKDALLKSLERFTSTSPENLRLELLDSLANLTEEGDEVIFPNDLLAQLSGVDQKIDFNSPDAPLLRDVGGEEDINRPGLKKVKKPIQMEDVHYIEHPFREDQNRAWICVLDGHAGRKCAEKASKLLPEAFANALQSASIDKNDYRDVFIEAYRNADISLKEFEYEGCTCTSIFVWKFKGKRYLQAANVGDSTAFLCSDGMAVQLTVDHRPTEPSEFLRLNSQGQKIISGQTRVNGLAVSRALGDHFPKQVESGITCDPFVSQVIEIQSKDSLFIIATDGLWDIITGQHACNILKEDHASAKEMAKKLTRTAIQSKKCTDNVTVIVALLS